MAIGHEAVAIGVVGGGRMGSGIAHAFLCSGSAVVLVESAEQVAAAHGRVAKLVSTSAHRGELDSSAEQVMSRLHATSAMEELQSCSLVVEAIPEDPVLKRSLLSQLEEIVTRQAVIATNTSSISIDLLGSEMLRPERLVGMHFFNPVPASSLIEIVHGSRTDQSTIETALRAAAALEKTPIVVRNSPGFATSRLGVALGLEAIRMVEEGVATAEDIDKGMVMGYRHPIGPLRLTDLVGLDVRLGIARYLHTELGDRFAPPRLLVDMVGRGQLGRKTGLGFFDWSGE